MANMLDLNPNDAVVILRGISIPLASDIGRAFISDCTRNKEKLLNDRQLCEKYGLTPEAWEKIAEDIAVLQAVDVEYQRRIRNGSAAQESAAKLFATAPAVLGNILNNEYASARHRIEAARELRAAANVGAERTGNTGDSERFTITINLGADEKLVIDKEIGPLTPNKDGERHDDDMER